MFSTPLIKNNERNKINFSDGLYIKNMEIKNICISFDFYDNFF